MIKEKSDRAKIFALEKQVRELKSENLILKEKYNKMKRRTETISQLFLLTKKIIKHRYTSEDCLRILLHELNRLERIAEGRRMPKTEFIVIGGEKNEINRQPYVENANTSSDAFQTTK